MSNDERNDDRQTTIPNLGKPPRPTWGGEQPAPNFDDPASIEPFRRKAQGFKLGGMLGSMLGPGVGEAMEAGGKAVMEWAESVRAELRDIAGSLKVVNHFLPGELGALHDELRAIRAELLHDREQRLADAAAMAEAFAGAAVDDGVGQICKCGRKQLAGFAGTCACGRGGKHRFAAAESKEIQATKGCPIEHHSPGCDCDGFGGAR